MPNYVEVSDEGGALTAAGDLSALGVRLNDQSLPPEVVWGDDEFGQTMREQYEKDSVPEDTLDEKPKLGRRLTEIGDATTGAVSLATTQELLNAIDIDGVHAPEV
jgi:hypothetical protein